MKWIPATKPPPAEYHSNAMEYKPLLLAFDDEKELRDRKHGVMGYYFGGLLNEWRIDGSPSEFHPTHWMPCPLTPKNGHVDREAELEECLAGFMAAGAQRGLYLDEGMVGWIKRVLKGKKRTPVEVWRPLVYKYRKTGQTPSGEWLCESFATGKIKRASEWGDVSTENTEQ